MSVLKRNEVIKQQGNNIFIYGNEKPFVLKPKEILQDYKREQSEPKRVKVKSR